MAHTEKSTAAERKGEIELILAVERKLQGNSDGISCGLQLDVLYA